MFENCSQKKRNLVVGAGVSGAMLANKLANVLNEDVLVIDRADEIGGLCLDYKDENGIYVNKFGVHIFHTDYEYIWKYLNKFSKFTPCFSKTRMVIEDKEVPCPLNLNSLKEIFPESFYKKIEAKLIKRYGINSNVSIIEFKKNPFLWDKDLDFLANYVYDVFLHFRQKQWLGHSYGSLKCILEKTLIKISKDDRTYKERFQGVPISGYKALIENILNHKNIKVLCDMQFKDVDTSGFDRIFYTGSIDEFFDYKFGSLEYKSGYFDFETIETEFYQTAPVVNYPKSYDFVKIHEFKHCLKNRVNKTVISKEYPKDFTILPNNQNQRLYPVLSDKNLKMYKLYKNEARKLKNIYFLGKLGDFRNYTMDKAIKRALEVFDSVKFESDMKEVSRNVFYNSDIKNRNGSEKVCY